MSQRTRLFFVKLSHFFRQFFRNSSDLDAAESQLPPAVLPSLQDHGMFSSDCTTASPPPLNVPPLPPTPTPTPPTSLSPAPAAPLPKSHDRSMFANAHHNVFNNPQFIEYSHVGSGLEKLLQSSMPDTFHDSAARYPPPRCHLGTRNDYITRITDWAVGNSDRHEPILWMRGPFGVGKTAVAQSCAEVLKSKHKLAAAIFFSRSNKDRDDPRRVFTSIAYQIATLCESFSVVVDTRVRKDPAFATKSLSTQFEDLLANPLSQSDITTSKIEGRVVVIDGLDECRGALEQCEIIRIIAASVRGQTTPLRWFITSRPEDPIIRTMKSPDLSSLSSHLELPVSRTIDREILLYLTDEFKKIRENHRLPLSWPPRETLTLLVERTAGLWIYATTIVRFINDENSYGPEDQLRIIFEFMEDVSAKVGPDNPLAEMDFFYTLIMQRIPLRIRTTVRKILLLHSACNWYSECIAGVLGLSLEQFHHSCTSIQSVMELQGSDPGSMRMYFYHASFLDFMKDPKRSKELCIYGDFLIKYRQELLDWLSHSTGPSHVTIPSEPPLDDWDHNDYYCYNLYCFWDLCSVPKHPFDLLTTASLEKLQFQIMLRLLVPFFLFSVKPQPFVDNLPIEHRNKIIREGKCPTPGCTNTKNVWILGHGENETVIKYDPRDVLLLMNNQNPPDGECPCGSPISGRRRDKKRRGLRLLFRGLMQAPN